ILSRAASLPASLPRIPSKSLREELAPWAFELARESQELLAGRRGAPLPGVSSAIVSNLALRRALDGVDGAATALLIERYCDSPSRSSRARLIERLERLERSPLLLAESGP